VALCPFEIIVFSTGCSASNIKYLGTDAKTWACIIRSLQTTFHPNVVEKPDTIKVPQKS
jgi:hypothetical protein